MANISNKDFNIPDALQEVALLKFLTLRDNYNKYISYIKDFNLEPETSFILDSITKFYEEFPDKESIPLSELLLFNSVRNKLSKRKELISELFSKLENLNVSSQLIQENFNILLERYYSSEILFKLSSALEANESDVLSEIRETIDEYEDAKLRLEDKEKHIVTQDITQIVQKRQEKPGLKWRLSSLNTHLGELRGKTLGHLFARVDTGKTSFVISEMSYWVSQLKDDECIIHFNNEEDGEKLMARFYQALLNVDQNALFTNPEKCRQMFIKAGGNRYILYDNAVINIEDIEAQLKSRNVKAIVIDQADKIYFHGMNKLGDVARLQMTYSKLRELSKKYDVHILTVGQASVTAENKKYLVPSDIDSSKTLKPGEFDYIIGIGKLFGKDTIDENIDVRYIHLCKNKLGTGLHAKFETLVNTARAIYREPTYEELEAAYGMPSPKTSPTDLAYMVEGTNTDTTGLIP